LQLVVTDLTRYLRGWAGYYGWCETKSQLQVLDGWTRRRLRRFSYWEAPIVTHRNRDGEIVVTQEIMEIVLKFAAVLTPGGEPFEDV
jgi:hypothetical protein